MMLCVVILWQMILCYTNTINDVLDSMFNFRNNDIVNEVAISIKNYKRLTKIVLPTAFIAMQISGQNKISNRIDPI